MRLTERDGNKVWFAHGRPRGFLCPRDFCDNAYGCDKVKDRTCPYLRLLDKLAAYEDTGLSPEEIKLNMDGLDEYRKVEAEGRLVILPCKVGDTVYYITGNGIYKAKAITFRFDESGIRVYCERKFMGLIGFEGIYGKTVFPTREEAEAALLKGETEDV